MEYSFTKVQIPSSAVSLGTACRKSCCAPELAVWKEKERENKPQHCLENFVDKTTNPFPLV